MHTSGLRTDPRAVDVRISNEALEVDLADGRVLRVPLDWFPRLQQASTIQRSTWQLIGGGIGISWPLLDEDVSVAGLLGAE